MARRDFWDESHNEDKLSPRKQRKEARYLEEDTQMVAYDRKFHPTRSTGFKVFVRIIMLIAAMGVALSLFIGYRYVSDRRTASGTYTTTYFESNGFSETFSDKIDHIMKLLQAVEKDETLLNEENRNTLNSLAESYLGDMGNFSYVIYDDSEPAKLMVKSGDDAVARIEASNHYVKVSSKGGTFSVTTSVTGNALNKSGWQSSLKARKNGYVIYGAVDNTLTEDDEFYEGYLRYDRITKYWSIAKYAGIAALVLFLICLIFSCIATGRDREHAGTRLTWFDMIPTELGAIITLAVTGGIIYGVYYIYKIGFRWRQYVLLAAVVVGYIFLIRCFLSLIRRLKSGEFVDNSIVYIIGSKINSGLNHLPRFLKYLIIVLILIVINGGLIYAQLKFRDITFKGVPVVFAASFAVFIIEFIVLLCCIFMRGSAEEKKKVHEAVIDQSIDKAIIEKAAERVEMEAEHVDLGEEEAAEATGAQIGQNIKEALDGGVYKMPQGMETGDTHANMGLGASDKTVVMTDEELNLVNSSVSDSAPEILDFTALNKEVRMTFRPYLREHEIGVTLRAPEDPVNVEISRTRGVRLLSILLDNIVQYAQKSSRVYIEIYKRDGRVIYMMKNKIADSVRDKVTTDLGGSLKEARRIVEGWGGRLITSIEGDTYKVGLIFEAAKAEPVKPEPERPEQPEVPGERTEPEVKVEAEEVEVPAEETVEAEGPAEVETPESEAVAEEAAEAVEETAEKIEEQAEETAAAVEEKAEEAVEEIKEIEE